MPPSESPQAHPEHRPLKWALRGAAGITSAPALILMSTMVGYGGVAREAGLSLAETMVGVLTVWALPSLLVMVSGVLSGASLVAVMIAVALSAVRLLPMTIAFVPLARQKHTPRWQLHLAAHYVAVTAWVFAMLRLADTPRPARLPYFLGFAATLSTLCTLLAGFAHFALDAFPPVVAGALFFMTPIYFLTALWSAARHRVDKVAMIAGLVLGPVLHQIDPQFDVLWAGAIGGTAAYMSARLAVRR